MVFKPWKNVRPTLGLLPVVQRAMHPAHPVTASGDVIPERKCLAVTDIVPACGRIHKSAFVKLKWLVRFGTALCLVLFLLTEAVPIFIATAFMAFVLFAMSVWHRESVADSVRGKMMGLAVIMFGILIDVPTISALGLFWIAVLNSEDVRPDARFLL